MMSVIASEARQPKKNKIAISYRTRNTSFLNPPGLPRRHAPRNDKFHPFFSLMKAILTIMLLTTLLTSCGFHLRQGYHLSPNLQNTYVQSNTTYDSLAISLRNALTNEGIQLAPNPSEASTIIHLATPVQNIQNDNIGNNQTTEIMTVNESATFSISTPSNGILLAPFTVSASRLLTLQSSQIISESSQGKVSYEAIERNLVTNIMERLASKDTANALDAYFSHTPKPPHETLS